ncbi:MAG: 16S rRNA (adenine(1518)-N(6)/adenine(1519)-N(6))-dimethyltransferase RsmA [Patescibacteria group bacterium]
MELASLREIKKILQKNRTSPSKGLGQNFLISRTALSQLIGAAELKREDTVLEIGPGIGVLTLELAKRVKKLIAVEKDRKMCQILKETLEAYKNLEIINADILKFNHNNYKLITKNYKLVANLPYYITSPVIRKFLEVEKPPDLMVLIVQKEVAQRICAKPPKLNLLAVSVQLYANPKIISFVPKNSFWPKPKVDGAIIQITQIKKDGKIDNQTFFKIVKAGFSQPRKQIINNLSKRLKLNKMQAESWLKSCKIEPEQRAETLSLSDWILLTEKFAIIK